MKNVSNICLLVSALLVFALVAGCNREAPALHVNEVVSDPGAFEVAP